MKTFNKNNTKVGDIVYSVESWTERVVKARVTEIMNDCVRFQALCFVDRNGNFSDTFLGSAGAAWDNLYATALDAYTDRDTKNAAQVQAYCDEIETIADLVRFPLDHCLTGDEYTDYNALKAYKQRMRDFGFSEEKEMDHDQMQISR